MLDLGHFIETLTPDYKPTGKEPAVLSVMIDSRQVEPGSLFVAFAGEKVDGHDYVSAAFERGAVAAIVQRPLPDHANFDTRQPNFQPQFDQPLCLIVDDSLAALQQTAKAWRARFSTRIIGITGSVGKTSTKELTYSVLSQRYTTLKSQGNYNNEIGLPLTLFNLNRGHHRAVLEMGMYTTGEIALLCDIARPNIGVVTMIGPVHLERVGTMEAIVAAKQELVESLPADGVAILNRDDERVMSMADHTSARVFTYGISDQADLWADGIKSVGLNGIRFTLHYGRHHLHVQVPLLGRHSVHTALRATAVGLVEEMSWDEIILGLQDSAAQLRLVAVPGPKGSTLIDDTYNSSPDSALAALNLLDDLGGQKIAVLGDMLELGSVEEASHRLVGRRAAEVADMIVVVGQRGRWIGEAAQAAGKSSAEVLFADDAGVAISILEEIIDANDTILIKGSWGMRLDRIVAALGEDS